MSCKARAFLSGAVLACLLASAATLVVTIACAGVNPVNPARCQGKTDCADGQCCAADYGCCGIWNGSEVCCGASFPHYCRSTNKCYQYFTDAQNACGTSYVICGGAVQ